MRNFLNRCAVSIALLALTGCFSVPLDYSKEKSLAVENTSQTREAGDVVRWLNGQTDVNGFYPLNKGFDAFGARLALMDNADVSIDAQYFLMKPDNAGLVFSAKLLEAADRGVRVRLLLDDIFTSVKDVDLAMLDSHPNFEVRIFNPISRKGIDTLNFLGHFSLTNRRMHNKAFIVDNQTAIVGGRNIAVEYFQLETSGEFFDFDMLSTGPIVKDVSAEFDTYWNHELAVPMAALFNDKEQKKVEESRAQVMREMDEAGDSIYGESVNTELVQQLYAQELGPYIADARLIADDPRKLLEEVSDEYRDMAREMRAELAKAESEILIFTPYFIPRKRGVEFVKELRAKGVRVLVLTNSLSTNNHTAVHSSYSSYRKDLLKAGVELWEARADAAKIITPEGESQLDQLTLHTKGMVLDRKRIFVGSLNLDPRSIDINTEMGLLIDSPELGDRLAQSSLRRIPELAYRLELDENDKITWHATIDGQEVVETTEPQTSAWRRFTAWFLQIAPESQL